MHASVGIRADIGILIRILLLIQ